MGNNRVLGHNTERYYCKRFKELGFNFCSTSRYASRLYDNAKIDLVNLPFNVQIKAGVQQNLSPGKELFMMENCVKSFFPPEDSVHNKEKILIHRKKCNKGKKRSDLDEIVYMSKEQYDKYQKKVNSHLEIVFNKKLRINIDSEFKHIIGITYAVFEEIIITQVYLNNGNIHRQ